MEKKYSQKEIDEIILTKSLSDFYITMIERRQGVLSDEDYAELMSKEIVVRGDNGEEVGELIQETENLLDVFPQDTKDLLNKVFLSFVEVRFAAILTEIDGEFYNITDPGFVDFKKNKVIHYEKLTHYCDESNSRFIYCTPEEEPMLKEPCIVLDLDESPEKDILFYEKLHAIQEENDDLTFDFIEAFKGRSYVKK